MTFDLNIATTFGLLLGVSLVAGLLAERIRLPKVTAYLMVGLATGPGVLDLIHEDHVHTLEPMLQLAMAMVLFNLGCQFPFRRIRQIAPRALLLSLGEVLCTFALVAGGMLVIGQSVGVAFLLGALAVATAPATTVLVLKEFESEGPVTEYANFLVALNNFASILIFELAFLAISLFQSTLEHPAWFEALMVCRNLLGSVCAGLVAGLLISYLCGWLSATRWLVTLVASTTFLLGICEMLDIPYLLTFLVMGVTVANTSQMTEKIVDELDHLTGLLCVLFFAVHGAELNVAAFLALGLTGAVYIVCRAVGKFAGIFATATLTAQPTEVRRWLGPALLAQAGAAIALSTIAVHRNPELGTAVQVVILGSVVVFEIIGPILIRESVLRAGEVPISQAIHHTSSTHANQLEDLWHQFLVAVGRLRPQAEPPGEVLVADLLRRNVRAIDQSASFNDVIAFIEESHDNTYPVTDPEGRVVGLIRYPSLSNVMFDNAISPLVRAEDLATPTQVVLYPDETAARAKQLFQLSPDDCLPVVAREPPESFLGVVRRRDVWQLMTRHARSD